MLRFKNGQTGNTLQVKSTERLVGENEWQYNKEFLEQDELHPQRTHIKFQKYTLKH